MKYNTLLIIFLLSVNLYSYENLGKDSGRREIILHNNGNDSDVAILILGGIHGDERETPNVVNYLKDNLESELTLYFIPELNPTLYDININRRGYLTEQLDSKGFIKSHSKLTDFNKGLYYRVFYGNNNTYKNGIKNYIDPNRDFVNRVLPSTRILIDFISELSIRHKEVVIVSIHGYMSGGRIYPEYKMESKTEYTVDSDVWEMATILGNGSGFKQEKMYSPAIPILDRFKGEFIAYTGTLDSVTAFDMELDGNGNTDNKIKSLNGVKALINYILDKE